MTTAMTLHLVLPIPGGTIIVDTDDPAALADRLVLDVLARVPDSDRIDHPINAAPERVTDLAGTAERAPVVEVAPVVTPRAPKTRPGRPPGPRSGPHAKGSIAAPGTTMHHILTVLADDGGRWEGTSQTLAVRAGSTPASGAKLIRNLAEGGLLTIERTGPRTVTAVALTGAGWTHLGRPMRADGPLPKLILTEPVAVPEDERPPAIDLATLPREGRKGFDVDAARAAAAGAM